MEEFPKNTPETQNDSPEVEQPKNMHEAIENVHKTLDRMQEEINGILDYMDKRSAELESTIERQSSQEIGNKALNADRAIDDQRYMDKEGFVHTDREDALSA